MNENKKLNKDYDSLQEILKKKECKINELDNIIKNNDNILNKIKEENKK